MNGLLALLIAPLLFFLPGFLIARLLVRCPDALSAGERIFIPIAVSILLTLWLGLTLAELGAFSLWRLSALVAILCAGLWLAFRRRMSAWSYRDLRPDWIFLAILVLAVWLFARPAEYILGNYDAGSYVNIGANIARTGAIVVYDAQVQTLPLDAAKTFYWQLINPFMLYKLVRLPGFFIADVERGLILPQFLHLYPVWLAIWFSLVGIPLGLYATPLLALCGAVAFYFVAKTLCHQNLARLAFLMLVLTVPQFWFARYPVAEVLTQFLVLTGMYAWRLTRGTTADCRLPTADSRPPTTAGFHLLAGVAFGEIFFTHADAILLLAPLGVYALVLFFLRAWRREHVAFFGGFAIILAHALAHMVIFAPNYLYFQYSHALRMKNLDKLLPGGLPKAEELWMRAEYWLLGAGLVILGLGVVLAVDRVVRWAWRRGGQTLVARGTQWASAVSHADTLGSWREKPRDIWPITRITRVAGAVSIVVLVTFAYFIWPQPQSVFAYLNGPASADRTANLLKLGWYLSPLGIGLATLGGVIVWLRDLNRANVFFFGTAALVSVFYLEELYSNPHYIYTTRHYLPLAIPLFILLAARALDWLWRLGTRARTRALARFAAGSVFALWLLYDLYAMGIVEASRAQGVALRVPFVQTPTAMAGLRLEPFERSIVGATELGGAWAQVEALARQLDPNAVIIFSNNRDEPATVATPLRFIFGRDAFVTVFNHPPGEKVAALIDGWRASGREVILAYGTNGGKLVIPRYSLERIGAFALDVPQWAFAYEFMPRSAWRVNLNYVLYRAVPRAALDEGTTYPFLIDFGGDDYPWLVSGFLERPTEGTARWIGAIPGRNPKGAEPATVSGVVRVPAAGDSSELRLSLQARALKPNTRLVLRSADKTLARATLAVEFAEYEFVVPRRALQEVAETYLLEFVVAAAPDGQGRFLGAEFKTLKITDD